MANNNNVNVGAQSTAGGGPTLCKPRDEENVRVVRNNTHPQVGEATSIPVISVLDDGLIPIDAAMLRRGNNSQQETATRRAQKENSKSGRDKRAHQCNGRQEEGGCKRKEEIDKSAPHL